LEFANGLRTDARTTDSIPYAAFSSEIVIAERSQSPLLDKRDDAASLREKVGKVTSLAQQVVKNGSVLDDTFEKLINFESSLKSHLRRHKSGSDIFNR
jgi:hypothetical protein